MLGETMGLATRSGLALALALIVGLAGCAALPVGDGTPTDGPAVDGGDGGSDGEGSHTRDGGDAAATTDEDVGDSTATLTAAPPSSRAATATTVEAGAGSSFSPAAHVRGLEAAGSYTLEFTIEASGDGGGGVFVGTQKTDLHTGERYSSPTIDAGWRNFSFEAYVPPNGETAYRHALGQTDSVPLEEADVFVNYSSVGANESTGQWPELDRVEAGETAFGPATVYGADSVDALPQATRDRYDTIENVRIRAWVDDDTDVITRYKYRLSVVEDGEERSIDMTFELVDLGSTTIDRPDWVPED